MILDLQYEFIEPGGKRENPMRLVVFLSILGGLLTLGAPARAVDLPGIATGGYVLLLRHALAPGTGDPADFRLEDCSTQRNLNDVGRQQSRAWGARIKALGADGIRVLSSQWCRCLETAAEMGVAEVEPFWPLNSFFTFRENEEKNLEALRRSFADLPQDGPLIVMVTHQVTVTAVTGRWVDSGAGWVLKLNGTEEPEIVGEIAAP